MNALNLNSYISGCCMQLGVHPSCLVACTFDIDISLVDNLPDPLLCTMDLPKFAACAAGQYRFLKDNLLKDNCYDHDFFVSYR